MSTSESYFVDVKTPKALAATAVYKVLAKLDEYERAEVLIAIGAAYGWKMRIKIGSGVPRQKPRRPRTAPRKR
jgi:hypothetical protein